MKYCWMIYWTDRFYKETWYRYNDVLDRLEKTINDVEMKISYMLYHISMSKSSWKISTSLTINAITLIIFPIFS